MMRRIKIILAVAMLLVSMLASSATPAMADDNNNRDTRLDRKDLRADRQLLNENNGFECCFEEENLFPFFGFSPFFGLDFDQEIEGTGNVTLNTTVS